MDAQLVEWSDLRHKLKTIGVFNPEVINGINAIADKGHTLEYPMQAIATPSSLIYNGGKIAISDDYYGEEDEGHMYDALESMGYDVYSPNKIVYVIM
jgi:hypothetical protein